MLSPCKLCGSRENLQDLHRLHDQPCIELDGDSCGPCKALVSLETEILAAQAALARLFDRHRELRRDLNGSHSLITRRLPIEVIASIFQFCLPTASEQAHVIKTEDRSEIELSMPLALGTVCHAWRKIAWSTPKLWNKLYLFIDSAKISEQNRLDMVQQWLSRSGDLMINIYAHYSNCRGWTSDWDPDYEIFIEEPQIILLEKDIQPYPIIDIINHYAHRWGELYLHLPALLLSQFRATSEAPRLQTVFLMPTSDELPEQADDHVWLIREARPQTVHLDLQKWDLSVLKFDFKFEWNAVTRLTLWRVHEALCVKIMMQAPELTHFDISTFVDQDQDQDQIVSAPIVHPKIQFFRYMSDQLYPGFRPPLHLPSLEEFNCGVTLCSQAQTNWLKSSLERSPSLQRLRLSVILAGGEELIDVLKRLPSVQHLQITFGQFTLSRFTSYTADCASMLFKHLSKTSIPDHPHPTNFLPNLESLECVFYTIDVPWSHISSIFGPCSEIGNPRHRPFMSLTVFDGRSQFLGASELKFDEIDKDVVLQFIKLKDAGVNIAISHGFVKKDMLKPLIEQHKADVGVGA